jgi:DNA-binding GntR family transcriptional regulator
MKFIGVTEGLLQHLREQIIAGKLKPGQKLNEIELSSSLETSRSPLREAFRMLAGEHLVDFVPRRGCFVTKVSIEDCMEIYEAREMLECFAIGLLKKKQIRKLPEVKVALKLSSNLEMPLEDDPAKKFAYLKRIADFHIKLVESAGNLKLKAYYHSIFPSLARYQSVYVFISGLMGQSQHDHEHIVALIEDSKYAEAQKLLRNHIRSWPKLIVEQHLMSIQTKN